ncbi:MAG: DUF1330 domain-containing protein [Erythrobacter sp.]
MSAAVPSHAQESAATAEAGAISFTLDEGEVLQIIAPQSRVGGRGARQEYYDFVLPQAEALGFQRLGGLSVQQKVVSDYDPGAFQFFSWPDSASFARFEAHPEWPAYRDRRPDGWEELKIYTVEMESDLMLRFDPDKHYTVVVAWLDKENGEHYSRYLEGIETAVERAGGRFIAKFHDPAYETNAGSPRAPGQITFVEWDSLDGFAEVQASQEYRARQPDFASGVERFEFYWLGL